MRWLQTVGTPSHSSTCSDTIFMATQAPSIPVLTKEQEDGEFDGVIHAGDYVSRTTCEP